MEGNDKKMPAPATASNQSQADLAEILLSSGALSEKDWEKLKVDQAATGLPLREIIQKNHLVSEEELTKAESRLYQIPLADLGDKAVSPEALSFVPRAVAERYNLLPFDYDREKGELSLAMANPLDLSAIDFVEKKAKAKVKPFISTQKEIEETIPLVYAQPLTAEVREALKERSGASGVEELEMTRLGQVIRQPPIAKIVTRILEFSLKARASDVHIEPEEEKTRVRYRIDGILHEKLVLPREVHEGVVSRIKILSGMKIDEKRIPQDGRFNFKTGTGEVDLRVSCLPTTHGEKIVMRLLKKQAGLFDLPELGLRGLALKNLQEAIARPHGIIIVCGPTGSGKTTTLYAALSKVNTSKVNIITLEDPVEYQIPGINQVQVNPAAGLTFASGLRSIVRQDPDIIMVGEIRDKETTELAIQAALTGHLVFSTLHTNDAAGAIPRLLDLGAEPFLLASSLTCVLAQRVVRKICLNCKEEYSPPTEVSANLKEVLGKLYEEKKTLKLFRGKKCSECNETGYLGRVGIFEVIPFSEKISRLVLERQDAATLEDEAIKEGMVTLKQDGYLKALEGITTIEEVLRVAEE